MSTVSRSERQIATLYLFHAPTGSVFDNIMTGGREAKEPLLREGFMNSILQLGARLRGRMATQRSKKGSEKVLGRVLGKGSQKGSEKGAFFYGFCNKKKNKPSEKGSQKGFWEEGFQKVPSTPSWRVRPLRRAPYESSCNSSRPTPCVCGASAPCSPSWREPPTTGAIPHEGQKNTMSPNSKPFGCESGYQEQWNILRKGPIRTSLTAEEGLTFFGGASCCFSYVVLLWQWMLWGGSFVLQNFGDVFFSGCIV